MILEARELVKHFGSVVAVGGVSFAIAQGEVFGFLGPNGAGKTTTINLLTGLARPTSGSMFLHGKEYTASPRRAQALMGVVPDESNLYEELDGFGNLCFCASLYGIPKRLRAPRARRLLVEFGLEDAGRRPFRAYSRGMKRKLTIAAAIIHEPALLFLDEPTTGIDVASARQIRQLLADLNHRGTSIFLTTHYIEEAERLCHRIAFIVAGKIVRTGTMEELMRDHQKGTTLRIAVEGTTRGLVEPIEERFPELTVQLADERSLRISSEVAIQLLPLLSFLSECSVTVTEARLIRPSLEEVFVNVTGIESGRMKQERESKKG